MDQVVNRIDPARVLRGMLPILVAALVVAGHAAPAVAAAETTVIPVVVNLYPGSGSTKAKAEEAVAEVNKIFKAAKADVELAVVKVNELTAKQAKEEGGDDGTPETGEGDAASDAIFNVPERKKAREYGTKEVEKLKGKKGVKLSMAKKPVAEMPLTPGVTLGNSPVMLIMEQNDAKKTGATMAHELGHVLGLVANHRIEGTLLADAQGHAPRPEDRDEHDKPYPERLAAGNLMSFARLRKGTHLTPDQVAVIKKNAPKYGHCTVQFKQLFAAVKCEQGFGRVADGVEVAAVPLLYDLTDVRLLFLGRDASSPAPLAGVLTVAGVPAAGEPVDALYALGFDADADPGTGVPYAGAPGIDRIVRVRVHGFGGSGSLLATGEVEDVVSRRRFSLPPPRFEPDQEFQEDDSLAGVVSYAATSLHLEIPLPLLGLAAPEVPVVASAGDGVMVWDTAEFLYDHEAWRKRPTLQTSGDGVPVPGEPYPYTLDGLEPWSPFTLFLDGEPVASGILDGSGSFAGELMVPTDLPTDVPHVLTARDSTGEVASGMTCPVWAAGGLEP